MDHRLASGSQRHIFHVSIFCCLAADLHEHDVAGNCVLLRREDA